MLRAAQRAAGRGGAPTGGTTSASSRACSPSRGWSSAAASRCRWASTSGGYAARSQHELDRAARSSTCAWSATSTSSSRHPVPGVHTRKVTAEQQLEAALDGLAFLVTHDAAAGAARRETSGADAPRTSGAVSRVRDLLRRKPRPGDRRPRRSRPPRRRRARPGRAAADRRDHVLPRRGPDAAAVDPATTAGSSATRTSTSSTTTPRTAPPTTCPATCCTSRRSAAASSTAPGWRWSATSAARCSQLYDVVMFCDTDEFIVPDPAKYAGLRAYVEARTRRPRRRRRRWASTCVHHVDAEPPLDLTQPLLGQRRLAKFLPLMCKPAIKWVPAHWSAGTHGVRTPYAVDPDLWMFHMKFGDRDHLQEAADHRLRMVEADGRSARHPVAPGRRRPSSSCSTGSPRRGPRRRRRSSSRRRASSWPHLVIEEPPGHFRAQKGSQMKLMENRRSSGSPSGSTARLARSGRPRT